MTSKKKFYLEERTAKCGKNIIEFAKNINPKKHEKNKENGK